MDTTRSKSPQKPGKPIGVVGNDALASLIIARLSQSGYRVLAHVGANPPPASSKLIEYVATPSDIGLACDLVASTIEDSTRLREILLGDADHSGLGAELGPGAIFVDFGIRPPRELQGLLGILGTRAIAVLDATAVSAGELGSTATPLRILVGGYPDAVDAALPCLESLGTVERTGPLGSAHTAAALMGYVEAAHHVADQDARAIGRALGLGDDLMQRVLDPVLPPANLVHLARRIDLAKKLATDRGVSADVIQLTRAKLAPRDDDAL